MDRDYWKRSIKKWFAPYKSNDSNLFGKNDGEHLFSGREVGGSNSGCELRRIRVWVTSHQQGPTFEKGTHLQSFDGNILYIGDDDNLVLFDAAMSPTLIPWFTVRFIEVW